MICWKLLLTFPSPSSNRCWQMWHGDCSTCTPATLLLYTEIYLPGMYCSHHRWWLRSVTLEMLVLSTFTQASWLGPSLVYQGHMGICHLNHLISTHDTVPDWTSSHLVTLHSSPSHRSERSDQIVFL